MSSLNYPKYPGLTVKPTKVEGIDSISFYCGNLKRDVTISVPVLSWDVDLDLHIDGCDCEKEHYVELQDLMQ